MSLVPSILVRWLQWSVSVALGNLMPLASGYLYTMWHTQTDIQICFLWFGKWWYELLALLEESLNSCFLLKEKRILHQLPCKLFYYLFINLKFDISRVMQNVLVVFSHKFCDICIHHTDLLALISFVWGFLNFRGSSVSNSTQVFLNDSKHSEYAVGSLFFTLSSVCQLLVRFITK